MSQDYTITIQGSDSLSSSRTVINDNYDALLTNFSGSTDPSSGVPLTGKDSYFWVDTGNSLVKMRKTDNSAFITVGPTDTDNFGHLRIDGSNVMTGNLDLDGNDLVLDADGDSYIHETADDVIAFVVGSVPTTVLEMDGTLATPGVTIRGGRFYIDADNDTYIDGSTDDSIAMLTSGYQRLAIQTIGMKLLDSTGGRAELRIESAETVTATGESGFFTLTGLIDATGTGGTPSFPQLPTGASNTFLGWVRCFDNAGTPVKGWLPLFG